MSSFLVGDRDGFTHDIARLVSMMAYTRRTTLDAVRDLTVEELDHVHDANSNSIGALLMHIAGVETAYQVATMNVAAKLLEPFEAALDLGPRARAEIRGHSVDHYIETLDRIRRRTLDEFASRNDEWLYEERPFWRGEPANNYFQWFHVMEDELNHRGQIRWLAKRLRG